VTKETKETKERNQQKETNRKKPSNLGHPFLYNTSPLERGDQTKVLVSLFAN
jgi:hypothetical protein